MNEFLRAALILLISLAAGSAIFLFLKYLLFPLTRRSKTALDDQIIKALRGPLFWAALVAGLYFSLTSLDSLKPYSSLVNHGTIILAILLAGYTVGRVTSVLFTWYGTEIAASTKSKIDDMLVPVGRKVALALIYATAGIFILDQLGIEIAPIVAGLGVGGLALALALQSTLANFFAGAHILTDGGITVGDFVELHGDIQGWVDNIGWRSTRIRTMADNIVVVPHSKLIESLVTNYSTPTNELKVKVPCGVSYGTDLNRVEKVTLEVAKQVMEETPGGAKDFQPVVRFKEFGDSNINFMVYLRVQHFTDQFPVVSEFIKRLHERFNAEGIEISYPVRKLYLPDTVRHSPPPSS